MLCNEMSDKGLLLLGSSVLSARTRSAPVWQPTSAFSTISDTK